MSRLVEQLRRRPALWGFFVLVACIALLGVSRLASVRDFDSRWQEVRTDRQQAFAVKAQRLFDRRLQKLMTVASDVSGDTALTRMLLSNARSSTISVFERLQKFSTPSNYTIELVDPVGNLLAWSGTAQLSDDILKEKTGQRDTTVFVARHGLVASLSLEMGFAHRQFFVVVSEPLERQFPGERRPAGGGFVDALSVDYGSPLQLVADSLTTTRGVQIPIRYGGSTVAYLLANQSSKEEIESHLTAGYDSWLNVLLAAALIFLCVAVAKPLSAKLPSPWIEFLTIAMVWLNRIVWRLLDVANGIQPSDYFKPTLYAAPFPMALSSSIGDLLLSLTALAISVYLLVQGVGEWFRRERKKRSINPALAIIVAVVAFGVYFWMCRGYAVAMRSIVFDSAIQFHNPFNVVPRPPVVILHVSIFLLTASLLGLTYLLLSFLHDVGERLGWSVFVRLGVGTILFVVCNLVLIFYDRELPSPTVLPALVMGLGVFARWWFIREEAKGHQSKITARGATVVVALSMVIALPLMDANLHEKDRHSVELLAEDVLKPQHTWYEFVLRDALRVIAVQSDTSAALIPHESMDALPNAFAIWSGSLLSRQGSGSAVVEYDADGKEIDRFSIGLSSYEQQQYLRKLFDAEEESFQVLQEAPSTTEKRVYGLWSTVRNEQGDVIGSIAMILARSAAVTVGLESSEPLLLSGRNPPRETFRKIEISEFIDGAVSTAGIADWYPGMPLPETVHRALYDRGERLYWESTTIGDNDYTSLFEREVNDPHRVIAISLQALDLRWHVFNFVKVALVYAGLLLVFGLVQLLRSWWRGELKSPSFRAKLFTALAVISIGPLILLGFYNQRVAEERIRQSVSTSLLRDLENVSERIHAYVTTQEDFDRGVNDDFCEAVASDVKVDFSIYRGRNLKASSMPELYAAAILDVRLPASAYVDALLLQKNSSLDDERIGSVEYLVGYKPIDIGGRTAGVIAVPTLYRQNEIEEDLAERNAFMFGAYSIVFVLTIAFSALTSTTLARPLSELTDAAQKIGHGNFDVKVPVRSRDEIGMLVQSFNDMTKDLKQSRDQLAQVERELAWKEMAKQVAHEIKNPLTPMKLSIQHLRQAFKDRVAEREQLLERVTQTVVEQIEVLTRIASEFSSFARLPERRFERVELNTLLQETIGLFGQIPQIEFRTKISDTPITVVADRDELRRVFINIIRNAVQAMGDRGRMEIGTSITDKQCSIRFEDNGPGILPELHDRVFEPNFSTKSEGMGLGLAISQRTIRDLGGEITFHSEIGKGTTFTITLPL